MRSPSVNRYSHLYKGALKGNNKLLKQEVMIRTQLSQLSSRI